MRSKTAVYEIHRDSDYLASGTHNGASAVTTLRDTSIDFRVAGVIEDLYIENETQSTNSVVATVTEHDITTDDDISWDNGDTYKIYKTGTKNSVISGVWTDVSAGFKVAKPDDLNRHGWFPKDYDIDDKGRKKVFGPGQPERN